MISIFCFPNAWVKIVYVHFLCIVLSLYFDLIGLVSSSWFLLPQYLGLCTILGVHYSEKHSCNFKLNPLRLLIYAWISAQLFIRSPFFIPLELSRRRVRCYTTCISISAGVTKTRVNTMSGCFRDSSSY